MTAPVRLAPSFHERVWGVHDLAPWFAEKRAEAKLGEAWFTTDPPLPILAKFLFTSEKLSVQVHPEGECGAGKTEMWHILRAAPGARIALGFTQPVTAGELREAAVSGEIEGLLRSIPVAPGETYLIPAGTVHAIGAGLAICEIQQNSDITYRLYDYRRPRELHLDRGVAAANLAAWRHPGAAVETALPDGWTRLAECRYFATDSIRIGRALSYQPDPERFELLICVQGAGRLNGESFPAGAVWLLPQGCGPVRIEADPTARLLRSHVPQA
jgi:mannose-6-phosphate isomerase